MATQVCLLCLTFGGIQLGAQPAAATPANEQTEKAAAAALVRQLQDQTIWTDANRSGDLHQALRQVPRYRPKELVPVLAKHVHYTPAAFSVSQGKSIYHAFHALKSYGLEAVEPLLQEIKASTIIPAGAEGAVKEIFEQEAERKTRMAVQCLEEIYTVGGFGPEMARARIELQMRSEGADTRERLKKALRHLSAKK